MFTNPQTSLIHLKMLVDIVKYQEIENRSVLHLKKKKIKLPQTSENKQICPYLPPQNKKQKHLHLGENLVIFSVDL